MDFQVDLIAENFSLCQKDQRVILFQDAINQANILLANKKWPSDRE